MSFVLIVRAIFPSKLLKASYSHKQFWVHGFRVSFGPLLVHLLWASLHYLCLSFSPRHAIWSKLMDSSTFSLEMLWSKQQLMKYSPLSCSCVRVYIYVCAVRHTRPGWVTPAHTHSWAHTCIWNAPKKAKGCLRSSAPSQPRREKERRERERELSAAEWVTWVADIHIDEEKHLIAVFLLQMAENKRANISGYNPQGNICVCLFLLLQHFWNK